MERKKNCCHHGHKSVLKNVVCDQEEDANHRRVEKDVGQMKSVCQGPEELVGEQVSERHHRPVVVRPSQNADVGPNGCAEYFAQVAKALDVRVVHHLRVIVIDEAVE